MTGPRESPYDGAMTSLPSSIGVATMDDDGTLVLDLRGPGGAEARMTYTKTDERYASVVSHLGGIAPGESKAVPPWPDPWDEARVEEAAHAHARAKGWGAGEYRLTILGTTKGGDAHVSLVHQDHREPLAIEVSATTYTVTRERPIPR